MIIIFLGLALLPPMTLPRSEYGTEQTLTVCEVIANPKVYEGKTVVIESLILASHHAALLEGKECGKGIYLTHEAGQKEGHWPAFDKALVRKASGLDSNPLCVKVRGVYHSKVPHGQSTIRQFEALDVLEIGSPSK